MCGCSWRADHAGVADTSPKCHLDALPGFKVRSLSLCVCVCVCVCVCACLGMGRSWGLTHAHTHTCIHIHAHAFTLFLTTALALVVAFAEWKRSTLLPGTCRSQSWMVAAMPCPTPTHSQTQRPPCITASRLTVCIRNELGRVFVSS